MFMSEQEAKQTAEDSQKETAMPRFYLKSVPDAEATEEAKGKQKFKDVLYVEIIKPGIRSQGFNGKASDDHKRRFAGALKRFEADDKTEVLDGFPIKECPLFTPAEKDNLRVLRFLTVESLAEAPDAALKGMGMRDMSNRAKRFLESLTGPAATANRLEALEKRLDAADFKAEEDAATIVALQEQLKAKPKGKKVAA